MRVTLWGTRGSLPAPLDGAAVRAKVKAALLKASGRSFAGPDAVDTFIDTELTFAERGTYGGNSPCVEIDAGNAEYVICDLGSGARVFGNAAMAQPKNREKPVYNVFMSHVHWDHIMGFPLFVPAYVPGQRIIIHGCHDNLESALRRQHTAPSFPVEYDELGADISFVPMTPGEPIEVAGMTVRAIEQNHKGGSYGYRFEHGGKSVVYSTDSEHKLEDTEQADAFVAFFRGADLVIFDTMYSLADALTIRQDWGHSSNIVAVEMCQQADVGNLCLFHHDPGSSDEVVSKLLDDSIRFEELSEEGGDLRVIAAYDGLEIDL